VNIYIAHYHFEEISSALFVCILPEKAVLEMTYTVSGGTLNLPHSLTLVIFYCSWTMNCLWLLPLCYQWLLSLMMSMYTC